MTPREDSEQEPIVALDDLAALSNHRDSGLNFNTRLPRNVVNLEVCLPKTRFVELPTEQTDDFPKTYSVVVQPNGNAQKPKNVIREYWRPFSDFEVDLLQTWDDDPALHAPVDPRFAFRRERAKTFEAKRHFPALVVNTEALPSWQLAAPKRRPWRRSTARTAARFSTSCKIVERQRAPLPDSATLGTQLSRPTSSKESKRQPKRAVAGAPKPFFAGGPSEAREIISDRRGLLAESKYDETREAQFKDYKEAKERWVGETTMLPTCRKPELSFAQQDIELEIQERRRSGRNACEELRRRYVSDLRKHKKDGNIQEVPPWARDSPSTDSEEIPTPEESTTDKPFDFFSNQFKERLTRKERASPLPDEELGDVAFSREDMKLD